MTTALDEFERSLIQASRELTGAPEVVVPDPPHRKHRRVRDRFGSLSLAAKGGIGVAAVLACAGGAFAILVPGASSSKLPAFECEINAHETVVAVNAVTGNPAIDCAKAWPQATGGRHAAPKLRDLRVWGTTNGHQTAAIVAPVKLGKPTVVGGSRAWSRLPIGWHLELPVVELGDQLNSVSLPFDSGTSAICSYGPSDVKAVRSLLKADGLSNWQVVLHGRRTFGKGSDAHIVNGPAYKTGCHVTFPYLVTQSDKVELLQARSMTRAQALALNVKRGSPRSVKSAHYTRLAYRTIRNVDARANRKLRASCESVPRATGLWRSAARAAGFTPTTPSLWKHADAVGPGHIDLKTFFDHYTLYQQPASQHTGTCAHVLTMLKENSGQFNVYVARIHP